MGDVRRYPVSVLWHGQQVSHAFVQNRRETGSANPSPDHFNYFIGIIVNLFALACRASYLPFLHCHIFGVQKQVYMNYSVQVKVMPLKELLDPQGKAVMGGLQNLGIRTVQDVRIGKTIQLQIEAATADEAKKIAENAS